MSIATAIQNAQTRVANCYTAISNKGGTLPATQNLANMPTAINSIPLDKLIINSTFAATLTCGDKSYTLTGMEKSHIFNVQQGGTYVCTASKPNSTTVSQTVTITDEITTIELIPVSPSDVQFVEYIETDKAYLQYIDTGYILKGTDIVDITCQFLETATTTSGDTRYSSVFGARNGSYRSRSFAVFLRYNGANNINYSRTWNEFGTGQSSETKRRLVCNQQNIKMYTDGVLTYDQSSTGTIEDCINNCLLFTLNTSSISSGSGITPDTAGGRQRVWEFKIYDADGVTLRVDLKPCYRIADQVIGFYDTVSGNFLTNGGDGNFIVGPDINQE